MWKIINIEERAKESPDSFQIPSHGERTSLQPGDYAKLIFELLEAKSSGEPNSERMWVLINDVDKNGYKGTLDNDPQIIDSLKAGDPISFHSSNIADITKK